MIWSGEVDDWHEGDHLAGAAERAGLDCGRARRLGRRRGRALREIVEKNQVAQRAAGHWGVPMMVFDGEPFFGQDRFDQFKWRLEQQGLKPRA